MPELLAPAGGPEPFRAALAAGADAIYCGLGNDFNARRGAHNFTAESFQEACRLAHLAGARVYVTQNVVIKTEEMPRALANIRRAWLLGADAFIIQDWGLMAEVARRWPEMELHVSTQANVHDARACLWCRDIGAKRVTLSRELSLKEMAHIAKTGVELEVFGHGAICFCYSGVCLMSSLAGDRSANRGLCAQPCRLPYALVDESGQEIQAPGRDRPLCPRDFYSFEDIAKLRDAGVGSLKVEGRMKAPDYVYAVISAYRAQMDDIARGKTPTPEDLLARRMRLKRAFNRDFTNAYLYGHAGDELMSYERSNNRGQLVGTVSSSRHLGTEKRYCGGANGGRARMRSFSSAETTVMLDEPVGKGDLLEIRPVKDPSQFLTAYAEKDARPGESLTLKTARAMTAGDVVRVIRSRAISDESAHAARLELPRKRAVAVRVEAHVGKPFVVEISTLDGAYTGRASGFTTEPARTRAVSKEELVEHVGRMGQSPFEPASFDISLDAGVGMGFSQVHKVRAQACQELEHALLAPYERTLEKAPDAHRIAQDLLAVRDAAHIERPLVARMHAQAQALPSQGALEVSVICADPACAQAALAAGADKIYVTTDAFADKPWPHEMASVCIPILDEVCREIDHERLDAYVVPGKRVAVGNVSELVLAQQRGALAEIRPCIPVHNESCVVALEAAGAQGLWLSPELSLEEIESLAQMASVPTGLVVLGRTRAMTSEHCVLQAAGRCIHDCARCTLRQQRISLKDQDGLLLPVRTDIHGRSRIYAAHPLDATPQIDILIAAGVTRFAADATLLNPQEAAQYTERILRAIKAARSGRKPAGRMQGATSGHLFSAIG
ncbi:MAG: DUF3656 domain-containing U32 family peptidase [Atopobiaceae bacterium]